VTQAQIHWLTSRLDEIVNPEGVFKADSIQDTLDFSETRRSPAALGIVANPDVFFPALNH
jgi:hypothetical protein